MRAATILWMVVGACAVNSAAQQLPLSAPSAVHSARSGPGSTELPKLIIPKVSRAPSIEDFITNSPREAEAKVTEFRQREPGDGSPVSEPTSAYLSYDDSNLYVVFVCQDNPDKVRAHMAKREDILNDDEVFLYLDTFHDRQHAYVFAANPSGIQSDGMFTEGDKDPDYNFDTLWYTEGHLTGDGYIVWMKIPFKSVRFSSENVQKWGIAVGRSIVRNNENSYWPFITQRVQGFVQQMAELDGLADISSGRNVQLIPYGTFTNARTLDSSGQRLVTDNVARAGLDSKIVLRDALTLDITLNPDFSQVESDDPQVTINQRYQVFFPEKRPLFVENASYFNTPINLFYSRRIVDPEFGARLTGKLGKWAIGALATDDRAPGGTLSSDNSATTRRAVNGVFSLHREFWNQSRIGLMSTSWNIGSSSNQVISMDARLRLSATWFLTGQAVRSYSRAQGQKATQGKAYYADLLRSGRHFTSESTYTDFSPDFATQLGYIKRVDLRQIEHYTGYLWKPESSRILDFGPTLDVLADWNHQGVLQDWYANLGFSMDLTGPTGFKVSRYETLERYLNQGFRYGKNVASFYSGWRKWLYVYGSVSQGEGVNYQPSGTLPPFLGNSLDTSFGLTWRPKPRARLDEIYYYDRLRPPGGPVVYTNHLLRTKFNYQFTRALSIRTIIDYYAVLPNVDLIRQERLKQVTGDILLTYLLNPGTALYIGYNNRHQNLAFDPENPPNLRRFGAPDYLTNSQVFIKLSYLFRF